MNESEQVKQLLKTTTKSNDGIQSVIIAGMLFNAIGIFYNERMFGMIRYL